MSFSLKLAILTELVKMKIRQDTFGFDGNFTDKELDKITTLTIFGTDSLEGIDKLKNLTKLMIRSYPTWNLKEMNTEIVNTISDFSPIESLKKLENLIIVNDNYIEKLDLTSLTNLRILFLIGNYNLKEVKGIDKLQNIKQIILCGNEFNSVGNVKKYILNTKDANVNVLDIKMYHQMFGKNSSNKRFLANQINSFESNISFGERVGFDNGLFELDYNKMQVLYREATRILKVLGIEELSTLDDIYKIYRYTSRSIEYDDTGLEKRSNLYNEIRYVSKDFNNYIMLRLKLINSSFSAIVNHKAVCEGYVNMMRFLLNMFDIKSSNVSCSIDGVEFNHSIIKFKWNDQWLYADPEKDRLNNPSKLFGLTREQIEKQYVLSSEEYIENFCQEKQLEK